MSNVQQGKEEEKEGKKKESSAYEWFGSIFISSLKKTSPSSTCMELISGPSWYGVMTLLSIAGIYRMKHNTF